MFGPLLLSRLVRAFVYRRSGLWSRALDLVLCSGPPAYHLAQTSLDTCALVHAGPAHWLSVCPVALGCLVGWDFGTGQPPEQTQVCSVNDTPLLASNGTVLPCSVWVRPCPLVVFMLSFMIRGRGGRVYPPILRMDVDARHLHTALRSRYTNIFMFDVYPCDRHFGSRSTR